MVLPSPIMVNTYGTATCDQLVSRKLAIAVSESTDSGGNGGGHRNLIASGSSVNSK